jgi:nitrate reductase cytochrome c-type subunit
MKKTIIVLLSLVMVFAFAGTAYAGMTGNNETNTWNPAGPTYAGPMVTTGDAQLRGGTAYSFSPVVNPHEDYQTTMNKCEACHSPHRAGSSGTSFKLLYGTTSTSGAGAVCQVCHVSQTYALADVYTNAGTVRGGHDIAAMTGGVPDSSWATTNATLSCSDCHSVHGADIVTGSKILRSLPTWNNAASAIHATDMTTFCTSCHNLNGGTNAVVNGISHYMGVADDAASTRGTVALSSLASTECGNCHAAPAGTSGSHTGEVKWPHDSVSIVGLGTGHSTAQVISQDSMDDHCLKCHGDAGYEVGVNY